MKAISIEQSIFKLFHELGMDTVSIVTYAGYGSSLFSRLGSSLKVAVQVRPDHAPSGCIASYLVRPQRLYGMHVSYRVNFISHFKYLGKKVTKQTKLLFTSYLVNRFIIQLFLEHNCNYKSPSSPNFPNQGQSMKYLDPRILTVLISSLAFISSTIWNQLVAEPLFEAA